MLEFCASGYMAVGVDEQGPLWRDSLIVSPRYGAGCGVNLDRVLQKLALDRQGVGALPVAYLGNHEARRRELHRRLADQYLYIHVDTCARHIGAVGQCRRLAAQAHGVILAPQIDSLPGADPGVGKTCTVNPGGVVVANGLGEHAYPQARIQLLVASLGQPDPARLGAQLHTLLEPFLVRYGMQSTGPAGPRPSRAACPGGRLPAAPASRRLSAELGSGVVPGTGGGAGAGSRVSRIARCVSIGTTGGRAMPKTGNDLHAELASVGAEGFDIQVLVGRLRRQGDRLEDPLIQFLTRLRLRPTSREAAPGYSEHPHWQAHLGRRIFCTIRGHNRKFFGLSYAGICRQRLLRHRPHAAISPER